MVVSVAGEMEARGPDPARRAAEPPPPHFALTAQ